MLATLNDICCVSELVSFALAVALESQQCAASHEEVWKQQQPSCTLLVPDAFLGFQVHSHLNLANAYGKLERNVDAAKAFRQVLKHDPRHKDAINKLAYFSVRELPSEQK